MDDARITKVLNETEHLLALSKQRDRPLQLEIVANASALGMLRKGSPYARRIHQLASENANVTFLACGFAMENAKLKEGHEIKLIPDAHKVDAALEQILRRLKAGWLYVRG
jgi:intracellular sulfur oxidation DsrE/DsrF family protein